MGEVELPLRGKEIKMQKTAGNHDPNAHNCLTKLRRGGGGEVFFVER